MAVKSKKVVKAKPEATKSFKSVHEAHRKGEIADKDYDNYNRKRVAVDNQIKRLNKRLEQYRIDYGEASSIYQNAAKAIVSYLGATSDAVKYATDGNGNREYITGIKRTQATEFMLTQDGNTQILDNIEHQFNKKPLVDYKRQLRNLKKTKEEYGTWDEGNRMTRADYRRAAREEYDLADSFNAALKYLYQEHDMLNQDWWSSKAAAINVIAGKGSRVTNKDMYQVILIAETHRMGKNMVLAKAGQETYAYTGGISQLHTVKKYDTIANTGLVIKKDKHSNEYWSANNIIKQAKSYDEEEAREMLGLNGDVDIIKSY